MQAPSRYGQVFVYGQKLINGGTIREDLSCVYVDLPKDKMHNLFNVFCMYHDGMKYQPPSFQPPSSIDNHLIGGSIALVTSSEMYNRHYLTTLNNREINFRCTKIEKLKVNTNYVKSILICVVENPEFSNIRDKAGLPFFIKDNTPFYFTFAVKRRFPSPDTFLSCPSLPIPTSKPEECVDSVRDYFRDKKFTGTLQLSEEAKLVYIKIDDAIVRKADELFHKANPKTRCLLPPYFNDAPLVYDNPIGAHITLVPSMDYTQQSTHFRKFVGKEFSFTCQSPEKIIPAHWKIVQYLWMITIASPDIEKLVNEASIIPRYGFHFTFQVCHTPEIQEKLEPYIASRLREEKQKAEELKVKKENDFVLKTLEQSKTEMQALKVLKGNKNLQVEPYQIEKAKNLGWSKVVAYLESNSAE